MGANAQSIGIVQYCSNCFVLSWLYHIIYIRPVEHKVTTYTEYIKLH